MIIFVTIFKMEKQYTLEELNYKISKFEEILNMNRTALAEYTERLDAVRRGYYDEWNETQLLDAINITKNAISFNEKTLMRLCWLRDNRHLSRRYRDAGY